MKRFTKLLFLPFIIATIAGCTPSEHIAIQTLSVENNNVSIENEKSTKITYSYTPRDANYMDIDMILDRNDIVDLSKDGTITGKKVGKCTLTILDNVTSLHETVNIEVTKAREPDVIDPNIFVIPTTPVDDTENFYVYCLEQSGNYGDGTLYKYGDIEILVDAGTAGVAEELKDLLEQNCLDHKIEFLISSHPHGDHFHGFYYNGISTLEAAGITSVDYIVDSGVNDGKGDANYQHYWRQNIVQYYVDKGATYRPVQQVVKNNAEHAIFTLNDNLKIQFFNTFRYYGDGTTSAGNGCSVACAIKFKNYNFFTFGDLPTSSEDSFINYYKTTSNVLYKDGDVNIFKASHHGSNGANSYNMLQLLNPSYCWASSGITGSNQAIGGVSAQHPYPDASKRIRDAVGIDNYYWVGTTGILQIKISDSGINFHGFGRQMANYYFEGELVDPMSENDLPFYKSKFGMSKAYL